MTDTNDIRNQATLRVNTTQKKEREMNISFNNSITNLTRNSLLSQNINIIDTIEEISLIMGSKYIDKDKLSEKNKLRNKCELIEGLLNKLKEINPEQFNQLIFEDFGDYEGSIKTNQKLEPPLSQMALLCCYYASNKSLNRRTRENYQSKLIKVLQSRDFSAIELFSFLDFNNKEQEIVKELKEIYKDAIYSSLTLIELFQKFKDLKERKKKIKTLIKSISFELSSNNEILKEERLTATLIELKRLVLFFSFDMKCLELSKILSNYKINISSDTLVEELLMLLGNTWLSFDWLQEKYQDKLSQYTLSQKIIYVQHIRTLLNYLPDQLYLEDEQKSNVSNIYDNLVNFYTDQED